MEQYYNNLSQQYLFVEIGKKIRAKKGVINLSVGDVRLPLPSKVCESGEKAAMELRSISGFRGYPPEQGYEFFRNAVVAYYEGRVDLTADEIFVSDGIKSELALMLDLFPKAKVVLPTPTYPAYIDANIVKGNEIVFCTSPPEFAADLVILCSPDNPTGRAMTRSELEAWVSYCRRYNATLIFDAAYESFASNGTIRSIFEIEGARECAIELCSLSKTAGFTGIRCGYTVICKSNRLHSVWLRVKSCVSNGVSYITQRMGECALTTALSDIRANTAYYMKNAEIMLKALDGAELSGGVDSPYIWLKCGEDGFERLLERGVGVTPGIGFGESGRDHVRINSFCLRSEALEASGLLKDFVRSL